MQKRGGQAPLCKPPSARSTVPDGLREPENVGQIATIAHGAILHRFGRLGRTCQVLKAARQNCFGARRLLANSSMTE
eukprot:4262778-Pyramimonas_sp.AAC.1